MWEARAGRGSFVIVTGVAGIGKSSLTQEAGRRVRSSGVTVATGRAYAFATSAFTPFVEIASFLQRSDLDATLRAVDLDTMTRFRHVTETLARLAPAAYLVFDDIHWADRESLDLLEYLASHVASLPLVVVATIRRDDPSYDLEAIERLARFERSGAFRIDLGSLELRDIEALIVDSVPHREIAATTRVSIATRADGNPYYAEHLVSLYLERGDGHFASAPTGLRSAVAARLASLDEAVRRVLRIGAALGPSFTVDDVDRFLEDDRRTIDDALRDARAASMIEEGDAATDRLRFTHPLIREAVHATFLGVEARALHRHIFETLRAAGETDTALLAEHAYEAGDPEATLHYGELAGTQALATNAYGVAAKYLERALESAAADDRARVRLSRALARASESADDPEDALRHLKRAASIAPACEDNETIARILMDAARAALNCGDTALLLDLDASLDEICGRGLAPATVFAKHVAFATYYSLKGRLDEARVALEKAAALPEERTPVERQRFLRARAQLSAYCGKPWDADAREAIACVDPERDAVSLFATQIILTPLAVSAGDMRLARELAEAAYDAAATGRVNRSWIGGALGNRAIVAWHGGELRQACDYADAALETLTTRNNARNTVMTAGLAAAALLEDVERIERLTDLDLTRTLAAAGEGSRYGYICAFSEALARFDDRTAHATVLHDALLSLESVSGSEHFLVHVARYGRDGDAAQARSALSACPHERGSVNEAYLDLFDAERATRTGRRSLEAAQRARLTFARIAWPYFEARALELGGDRIASLALYRKIGDARDARRLESASGDRHVLAPAHLTRREREIARLIASGATTPAIAETLVLSARTVETHIAAIFRKRGLATRTALAALVAAEPDAFAS